MQDKEPMQPFYIHLCVYKSIYIHVYVHIFIYIYFNINMYIHVYIRLLITYINAYPHIILSDMPEKKRSPHAICSYKLICIYLHMNI
jgi:hypothetical protein